ncbi:MAG: sensor histidine kinase [Candidatus Caenarcaniphilales bacterium]|nr:sensor histidine kinase [Candidatus Caenarcaniphilales bacterium]
MSELIKFLDTNLPFISEILLADIKLFVKTTNSDGQEEIFVHNFYHSQQDSFYLASAEKTIDKGRKFQIHKDAFIQKAFQLARPLVGQYGLVIENRKIQEFAYPILDSDFGGDKDEAIAVIAIQRDIYLTRFSLGRHWDFVADLLIRTLKHKMTEEDTNLPSISLGEGVILLKENRNIFFPNPISVNLLAEIAEHTNQLVGRSFDELIRSYPKKYRGKSKPCSIEEIQEITLRRKSLRLRYVSLTDGYSAVILKDISEVKIKETLLKEIHHRVKNNLQTVASLLRMQQRRNPELAECFSEAINRTSSISIVHESLSHSDDIENVDFGYLAQQIIKNLLASFGKENLSVNFYCPKKILIQSEEATNLALILNELMSNSLEHAGEKLSQLDISLNYLEYDSDTLSLSIADDGTGFPYDFDFQNNTGLGWEIVKNLAQECLDAKINIDKEHSGAKIEILIPVKKLSTIQADE